MGRKLKVRTFIFPNYVKNYDQILYRNFFIIAILFTIMLANILASLAALIDYEVEDVDQPQKEKKHSNRNPEWRCHPPP